LNGTSKEEKYLKKDIKIIEQDKSGAQDIHIMCNKSVEVVIFYLFSFHFFIINCQLQ